MASAVDEDLWSRCKAMVGHLRHPDHIPYYCGALGGLDQEDPGQAVKVYLVDGDLVKILHDMDFVEANNSEESPEFMPEDTIWLDVTNDPYEWKFNLYHEAHEYRDMCKGDSYDVAHEKANAGEKELRIKFRRQTGKKMPEVKRAT